MGRRPLPKKFKNKIALMRLLDKVTYSRVAEYNRVSIGTVQNCVKQYKTDHPIWLKVRAVVHKLVN